MKLIDFENVVLSQLESVITKIIKDKKILNISAKSRAGAEISDYLEDKFVSYTNNHQYFSLSESSPKGATKNPWDVKTYFSINSHKEEVWIDFKAFKITSADSNPDIGSPDKIIKFIINGNFYMTFIFVYYQEKGKGIEFVNQNGKFVKVYFLKDISSTFRRNPKNQLQVNISAPPEHRTREDFIKLLMKKIKDSHERQILISEKKLKTIKTYENKLIKSNKESEAKILNI